MASATVSKPRRLRPAAPRGRGGASSLLRLSRASAALPSGAALTGWMARAASVMVPDAGIAPR